MIGRFLNRHFHLASNDTSIKQEVIAGLTTFAAMSYILIVNPGILGLSGMPTEGLITVTALAACAGTLMMALATNYPIALAPGMGLNAFFAFTICMAREIPWDAALGIVFYNGVIFLALTLSGVRRKIADAIPDALKIGVQCGIGLFIAFIGLRNAGLIVSNPATFVTLGDLSQPSTLLAFAGIVLAIVLSVKRITGAILISIFAITLTGLFVPTQEGTLTPMPETIVGMPESISSTFLAMDLVYPLENFASTWDLIFALMFVNMFDTIGTLIGVSRRARLVDSKGNLPKMGPAMTADATASIAGAALGTSPVTSYVESAAGVSAGGKTGLTAVVVAVCFILALFLSPMMKVIPLMATTPALVMVGIYMMDALRHLDYDDAAAMATASVTLIAMPLTFSISEGIAMGFITYVGIKIGLGQYRRVSTLTFVLTAIFMLRYVFDLK